MMLNHRNVWSIISCIAAVCAPSAFTAVHAQSSTGIPLGSFVTRMHNVAGDVVLLSERVMEVRNFVYDGEAPAVYFWADTNAVPSSAGYRLYDGSPNNGCGVNPLPVEADGSATYRVEFPDGMTIYDLQGGSISLWCEQFSVSFGEVVIPTGLTGVPTAANGPDLECSANVEETPVASPTAVPVSAPIAAPTMTEEEPVATPAAVPTASPVMTDEEGEAPVASPRSAPVSAPTMTNEEGGEAPVASPTSVTVPAPTVTTEDEPYLLGNLTTRAHAVTGTVYIISDRIIEIRVCDILI